MKTPAREASKNGGFQTAVGDLEIALPWLAFRI
jgi:hypothetical protein